MLVATLLRRKIAALETAGKLRGEVVIVPVPNPIGLSQHVFGDHLGRFEPARCRTSTAISTISRRSCCRASNTA